MAMLDELEAEKLEADAIRKIQYGDKEWQPNKLRSDSGATLTEQNLFARDFEDLNLLSMHRAEDFCAYRASVQIRIPGAPGGCAAPDRPAGVPL